MTEPWKQPPLDKWSIIGMNHYVMDGEKRLFVAMVKDEHYIKEQGNDDKYLWNRLWHKASKLGEEVKKDYTILDEKFIGLKND